MKCPQCGIDVPDSTRFCSECGSPLLSGDARGMTKTVKASYMQRMGKEAQDVLTEEVAGEVAAAGC